MKLLQMKFGFIIVLLSITAQAELTASDSEYTLFANGSTDYKIVVNADAAAGEKLAASELAKYLKHISGADFPVVSQPDNSEALIFIGYNTSKPYLPFKFGMPDNEAFTITNRAGRIFILGDQDRGTLYGVYTFLEELFGCRWYTSKVTVVPQRSVYKFSKIDIQQRPVIQFRAVDYVDYWTAEQAIPNKVNAQFHGSQPSSYIEELWLEHSFRFFIPASQYFETHPEYFSLIDGKRQKEVIHSNGRKLGTQLCLTNPDILKLCIDGLEKYIKENPQYKVYNIAQNDNKNPCQCEKCRAIVKREEAESGLMIWFVNEVTDAIKDEYPDKRFATFAYQYTRKPPKHIRPNKDLIIVLCSIECDYSHPFDHPHNISFLEHLRNWQDISGNILIWDYVVNFRHYFLPHPNFNAMQKNIQILRDAGVKTILEQANGLGYGGEFEGLRGWVLAKLLWNPDADMRLLIEDYIAGYYQKAGPYILRYFDLVQSLATEDSFITYATQLDNPIFTVEFSKQANELFDKAEAAADNDEILHRVEVARLGVIYMNIMTDLGDADKKSELDRLEKITSRENIVWSSEGGTTKKFVEKIRSKLDEQ